MNRGEITLKRKLTNFIWISPFIFLIHDTEEIITVESWVKNHQEVINEYPFFKSLLTYASYTTLHFAITVAFIFTMLIVITRFASKSPDGWGMKCFIAAIYILFINVFTHVGQTILLGTYTPGVVTAVLIVLPFTTIVLRNLKRMNILSEKVKFHSTVLAVLFAPVIFAPLFLLNIFL